MRPVLLLSLALALAFAAPVASAESEDCEGVPGVQELCTYQGPTGQQCYYWKGLVLDGHPFC